MFLLLDKPTGKTSHDMISLLRRITGEKKIGHAGTLDPFATGLLIIAIGRNSTRQIDNLKNLPKTYVCTIQLGATSDTYDLTGKITPIKDISTPQKISIEKAISSFVGQIKQTPPQFSAKKIAGKRAYELARIGESVDLKSQTITIHDFSLLSFSPNKKQIEIKVTCSAGTYIRSLAHDLGQKLETGAYTLALRRTNIDKFSVKNAIKPTELTPKNWQTKTLTNLKTNTKPHTTLIVGSFPNDWNQYENWLSQNTGHDTTINCLFTGIDPKKEQAIRHSSIVKNIYFPPQSDSQKYKPIKKLSTTTTIFFYTSDKELYSFQAADNKYDFSKFTKIKIIKLYQASPNDFGIERGVES